MDFRCRNRVPCFFFLFLCFVSSQSASTLLRGQSIQGNQTLISSGENFVLGFFSPGRSTNRYVGIWYNNLPVQTIVWVANRENPVTDSSAVLTIESGGNLVIKDSNHGILWSTNVSKAWSSSEAVLEDSGNLVLIATDSSNNSMDLWRSFDHPTDTFLPGMKVGLDLKTGVTQLLKPWKGAEDPSPGQLSVGVDPRRTAQVVIWDGPNRIWRSGQWDGLGFTGILGMRQLNLYGFKLINDYDEGKMYVTYSTYGTNTIMRFFITRDGKGQQLVWDEEQKTWKVTWTQPIIDCENYGKCGPYGICGGSGARTLMTDAGDGPLCNCLRGFEPKSMMDWSRGDWSGGCVRRRKLGCKKKESNAVRDVFYKVKGLKLPDFSEWVTVDDKKECEKMCVKNCSCKAYAYVDGIGCLKWDEDLIDTRAFSHGGKDLYLRLDKSELGKMSDRTLTVVLIVLLLVWSICAYLLWRWRADLVDLWKEEKEELPFFLPQPSTSFLDPSELGDEEGKGPPLPLYGFLCVALSTGNFSNAKKLGEGGFGPVYKGKLPQGQEIAVKRLSKVSGQGLEQFKNEVLLIAKLQHRNLVRLLGCCIEGDERILLYEYMSNGSLDAILFDRKRQSQLDWTKRFNIIEGIARGLLYLHRDSRLIIIHRDLKASNILLDEQMIPKISDFGMAKIFSGNQNKENTNRVVGTYGYMPPEYAMEGIFSVKSDVYSFGVLILEIVSGKKNSAFHYHNLESMNLVGHAWQLWNEDKGIELIDPSLCNSYSQRQVLKCIHVGLLCVQDCAIDRPTMSDVVLMLEGDNRIFNLPKRPTYSLGHSTEIEPYNTSERNLANDTSITVLTGR